MVAPLDQGGSNFPCKGYLKDLSTPAGKSSKTYTAGKPATFRTEGVAAAHNGGSCQVSLSFDKGKTWKVIKSFIGNCVRSAGGNVFDKNQTYSFTIPAEAKAGDAIWAWTWFNQTGNREMYMNCAHITIKGSGTSTLKDRPDMFVANVGNQCTTKEGNPVEFPNPGRDVERKPSVGSPPPPPAPPVGKCPAGAGGRPPAAPAKAKPAPGRGRKHKVAAGEFCASIAKANGISVQALIAANPSVNSGCTNLKVGQVLNLRRRSRVMRGIA